MADGLRKAMVYLGLADAVEQEETQAQNSEPKTQVRVVEDNVPKRPAEAPRPQPVVRQAAPQTQAREPETEYRAPVTLIKRAPSVRDEDSELRQINNRYSRS